MNCKINVKVFFLLFLVCTCCNSLCAQSAIPPFKKGERVVFVGNSITHGGHYHSFVWLYYMTRFPNKPITIMNAGIGRVHGILKIGWTTMFLTENRLM